MQLPSFIHNPITQLTDQLLSSAFLVLSSVYSREDRSIDGVLSQNYDVSLFVSNHCSILDTFFYLLKYLLLECKAVTRESTGPA